ncbi:MAG: Hsp70 family protein [Parvibaculum sp.]
MTNWLGVDFGTSNSAAAYLSGGNVVNVELEPGRGMIPTAVFFDFHERSVLSGSAANQALMDGLDGRYMRSLKSVLGTSLMREERMLLGRRTDFFEIITEFLRQLKQRAEQSSGMRFDHAVSGRPVFFHRGDAGKDCQAQDDLEVCYLKAGFASVKFVFEPVAAALASARKTPDGSIGLVVDIGGGTSDFTLFRATHNNIEIISSNGLRLGGTNFDRQINFDHFMPLLGKGHDLKRRLPDGIIQAPAHIFGELATWEKIPFLYDPKTILFAEGLLRDAVEPPVFARLVRVLQMRLGHDLAFVAEKTKIAYNQTGAQSMVELGVIEPGLSIALSLEGFDMSLSKFGQQIAEVVLETLELGKIGARDVERVITVGGSSSMNLVTQAIEACLPNIEIQQGAVFTSVVDGLAIASQEKGASRGQ